jgi:predicted short-subunit dehydrogenase-like oxidoreductase (DUF2520 family)
VNFAPPEYPAILPAMAARPSIAIVGPGRLGSALAVELSRAGYTIAEIISRDRPGSRRRARAIAKLVRARATVIGDPLLEADLFWLCVPDRSIASVARDLSASLDWHGKTAFHSSGALTSDDLNVLRRRGAAVASVHPMMTFVDKSRPSLAGVPFALEGDRKALRRARQIAKSLKAPAFAIRKRDKPAYHAWGAFTSPLLVAALVTMEKVAFAAGLKAVDARKKMLPIVKQTMKNYAQLGPAEAFSGPLVRGDVETVRRHLKVLKSVPGAKDVYRALAGAALLYLPVGQRKKIEQILFR